jgi:hypothetical protein
MPSCCYVLPVVQLFIIQLLLLALDSDKVTWVGSTLPPRQSSSSSVPKLARSFCFRVCEVISKFGQHKYSVWDASGAGASLDLSGKSR